MECREIELTYKRAKKNSSLKRIASSKDVVDNCHEFFPMDKMNMQEHFFAIMLNNSGKVLGVLKVSEGTINATSVDAKFIIGTAIKCLAHGIILVHNHTSGEVRPSPQDERLTHRIKEGAALFDIKVLDHIILTDDKGVFYSFSDYGKL